MVVRTRTSREHPLEKENLPLIMVEKSKHRACDLNGNAFLKKGWRRFPK
jgi:hypothetical protein